MSESVDQMDLDNMEAFRGTTPHDIKQKCFDLCQRYLSGVWLKLSLDQIEVKRLSGGFTNQLYYCKISKNDEPVGDEPQEVAIRLYGDKHWNNNLGSNQNDRLPDVVIGLLVSEYKLGPKIYGLFEDGQIQHYYQHKQFQIEEQNNPKLVKELAQKLARVHSMEVPVKKTGNWIFEAFDTFYSDAYQKFPINELIDECNCEALKNNDLKQEIDWIKNLVTRTNSPIVFCHNDFRGDNVLVTESEGLVLCDFEYSCYGYRGYDFGLFYTQWGRTKNDLMKLHDFPEDSVIKPFIDEYISEMIKINGERYADNSMNRFEQLLKETKIFVLVSNLFSVAFILKLDEEKEVMVWDRKHYMAFAERFYQNYFHLKKRFTDERVI